MFLLVAVLVTIAGALQCFAPRTLREYQKRLRFQHVDRSASAGGRFFEDLAERNANSPSFGYRAGGFGLMLGGIYMFLSVVVRLFR